jgi:putative membrane protein
MEFPPDFWPHLWGGLIGSLIFGLLGILLTVLGFKVFDWALPKIDIQRELTEKNNIAVAIVSAAAIIGVSVIIAAAVN